MTIVRAGALGLAILGTMPFGAPAVAATLQVEQFSGDMTFNDRCGGADNFGCEFAVAEGRAGNRAPNGNGELQIFDRITNASQSAQAAAGTNFGAANSFTLTYDGAGTTILSYLGNSITKTGLSYGAGFLGDNPTGPAQSLYVRVRDANIANLMFGSASVGSLLGLGSSTAEYLVIAGADLTRSWTLSGDVTLGGGNNSASAFQVKVTDLQPEVAPIPLPPGIALLAGGLGVLGMARRRRRARA